jgi:hypothetical protein
MIRPMLDDLVLPQVQEITTLDRRALTEHKPPGMAGSLLQNLGRRPLRVVLWGIALGPDAQAFAQKLDDKFRAATPVPFTADIVADARLDLVVIEDLRLKELAGIPLRVSYVLTLSEFIKPVTPATATANTAIPGGIDPAIADDALKRVQDIAGGIAAAQTLATGLERFIPQFAALLTKLQTAAPKP